MNLCPICSKPILRKSLTYCSMACYSEARKKKVDVICAKCSTTFSVRPFEYTRSKKHYCTNCRQRWENRGPVKKIPTGYILNCYYCGVTIYRQRWYSRRYLYSFCSRECRSAGWRSLRLAHEGLNPKT